LQSRKTVECFLSSSNTQLSQGRHGTYCYTRAIIAKKVEGSVVEAVF
jgi:hypothetical protein